MFVIIKVGAYLATLLSSSGVEVKIIEQRPEEIPALQRDLSPEAVLPGSGTDPKVLELAGARGADGCGRPRATGTPMRPCESHPSINAFRLKPR